VKRGDEKFIAVALASGIRLNAITRNVCYTVCVRVRIT